MQVRALYDFAAQPGSGELTLKAGELLTVTKQDIGDGWWEGINEQGVHGLFPESYVEKLAASNHGPPAMPPPPLPENVAVIRRQQSQTQSINSITTSTGQTGTTEENNGQANNMDSFRNSFTGSITQRTSSDAGSHNKFGQQTSIGGGSSGGGLTAGGGVAGLGEDFDDDFSRSDDESGFDQTEPTETLEGAARPLTASGGGVKKSMNRFSRFVQSGMEAFILNQIKMAPPAKEEIYDVTITSNGPRWSTTPTNQYTCRLSSFKKASKMKGLKSFINYELTPSFSPNNSVERRYKHFDWLHSRLESKFTFMLLPPLPEKQAGGRSEDEFVEHRMQLLQMWIDRICRHPVMSKADVWMHFLTTAPDGKEWKNGKRKAEKDQYVGGNFFFGVNAPVQSLDATTVEQRVDIFARKSKSLDDSTRATTQAATDSIKHVCGPFRGEFLKYGNIFRSLSQAMTDEAGANVQAGQLAAALRFTGDKYDSVAKMCADQSKQDYEPLLDELFMYRGVLSSVPRIVQTEKNVLARLREHQKLAEDGKMAPAELEAIRARVDTVTYAMLAEVNHFEQEHVRDMKSFVKDFLMAQVTFFDNIKKELQEAAQLFS